MKNYYLNAGVDAIYRVLDIKAAPLFAREQIVAIIEAAAAEQYKEDHPVTEAPIPEVAAAYDDRDSIQFASSFTSTPEPPAPMAAAKPDDTEEVAESFFRVSLKPHLSSTDKFLYHTDGVLAIQIGNGSAANRYSVRYSGTLAEASKVVPQGTYLDEITGQDWLMDSKGRSR